MIIRYLYFMLITATLLPALSACILMWTVEFPTNVQPEGEWVFSRRFVSAIGVRFWRNPMASILVIVSSICLLVSIYWMLFIPPTAENNIGSHRIQDAKLSQKEAHGTVDIAKESRLGQSDSR